jgi:hypothetical protein
MTLRALNGPESKLQSMQWETPAAQRYIKTNYGIATIHCTRPTNQPDLLRRNFGEVREAARDDDARNYGPSDSALSSIS